MLRRALAWLLRWVTPRCSRRVSVDVPASINVRTL